MKIFCKTFLRRVPARNEPARRRQVSSRLARPTPTYRRFEQDQADLPERHRAVVANCFQFKFEQNEPSRENATLRQAMCAAIMEPLEEACKMF